jgi:hypothetical protein
VQLKFFAEREVELLHEVHGSSTEILDDFVDEGQGS